MTLPLTLLILGLFVIAGMFRIATKAFREADKCSGCEAGYLVDGHCSFCEDV